MKRANRRLHIALWLLIVPALVLLLVKAYEARRPVPLEPRLGQAGTTHDHRSANG